MAAQGARLSADDPQVQALLHNFVAELKAAHTEGRPFSGVLRVAGLDPLLNAAANDDVPAARCDAAAAAHGARARATLGDESPSLKFA
jgi:hypothetical protein